MDFPVEIYNRPGLPAIRYRCGSHSQFKHFMLSQLSARNRAALHVLTTRADDDFTIALLDALAVLSDVLTFYQERIAQESYLRTATERFSITHMARFVGYKPKPGLAAATWLVFTLDTAPGSPQTVLIPDETQAQSIPKAQDKLPQIFETTEPLTARVEWNELRPRMTQSQTVFLSNGRVFLQGANLNLQTGDVLLFMDKHNKALWNIVRITRAEPEPKFDRTEVNWFWTAIEAQKVSSKSEEVDVFIFRERANFFGYNAPEWGALPDIAKATYLGITDPAELTPQELLEWPQFFIQAPIFPHEYSLPVEPYRYVDPTPESVAAAVNAVAQASTDALQGMALSSIPNAAIQVIQAITTILDSIFGANGIAQRFQESIGNGQSAYDQAMENLTGSLQSILSSLVSFGDLDIKLTVVQEDDSPKIKIKTDADWTEFNPYNVLQWPDFFTALIQMFNSIRLYTPSLDQTLIDNLIENLANLVASFPILAPYQAVADMLNPGNPENPLTTIGAAINSAASAVTNVPESMAKAVGGHIVAKVVTLAVQAIMEMPIFKTDDVNLNELFGDDTIDFSQLEGARLSLTPELVAFTAVVSAKMAVAVLAGVNITEPENLLNSIFTSELEKTVDENGQPVFDDEIGLEPLATGILGVTMIGGAYLAANTLMLAFVWPSIVPLIIPIAVGYFIFAATLGDDVFEGAKETQTWIRKAVHAALQPRKEDLSPRKAFKRLRLDQIDLDTIYSKITPGSMVLLSLPQTQALYGVKAVTEASRSDFTLNAQVTRVTLEDAETSEPADFGPIEDGTGPENPFRRCVRMTTVFADSRKLEFSEEPDTDPVSVGNEGAGITLDRLIPELEIDRRLIMTGLSHVDSEPLVDPLTLKEQKKSESGDFSELVFHGRGGDIHQYRRESVKIFANVAPATHGATVEEVLGSGDAAQASQAFQLRQPPVTHVASGSGTGSTSTLEVRVNDVLWEEVPYLYDIGPITRAYSTEINEKGETTIHFGDGLNGARPHTGLENIRARYRSGIGTSGNVGAGDISLLTRRPPGVVHVTNPLPAESGSDPEPPSNIRSNIPSTTLLLDRIVSLRDYEDFAAAFPDVCKARAVQQGYGPDRKIYVTVAGYEGSPVADGRLGDLMDAARKNGDPFIPIEVRNFKKVSFVLAAQITYHHTYPVQNVADGVRVALENHFSFDSRQFGQSVTLMEIMALIQEVAGVASLDIDRLYGTDQETASKISIRCKYSATDYDEVVGKYPNVLEDYPRVSPRELLLPQEITLLFVKEDDRK